MGALKVAKEKLTAIKILAVVVLTALATVFACVLYFGLVLTTSFFFPNSSILWAVILSPCILYLATMVWVVLRFKRKRETVYMVISAIVGATLIFEGLSLAIVGTRWLFFVFLIGGAILLISLVIYIVRTYRRKA